jgi:ribosomal protein L29
MDIIEIKSKSERELHELLAEKRNELRELRFKVSEKQLKNVSEVRKVRRTIAKILTVLKNSKSKK